MYSHVIWDWNGTLLDDVRLCVEILNGLLRRNRLNPVSLAEYREVFDFPVKKYYEKLGFNVSHESFTKLGVEFFIDFDRRFHECKLRPAAVETITRLKHDNIGQSILSAMEHNALSDMVSGYLDIAVFAGVQGISNKEASGKIDEGRLLIEKIGVDPASILVVGDTTHDHTVAEMLGAGCVLVSGGHHSKERLESTGAKVVGSIGEIITSRLF